MALEPPERLFLNEQPLKYLEEKDPDLEDISEFKYLGVSLPQNGSWTRFIDNQLMKANKTLGQFWSFFHDATVSTRFKIEIANATIFSQLSYCQEIAILSAADERKIDRFQAKVLRTILRVPSYASGNAVRYILGQVPLSSKMRVSRILNYLRIIQMPPDTRLRQILDQKVWRKKTEIFGKYEEDLLILRRLQHLSSVTSAELESALKNGNTAKTKAMLKRVTHEGELAQMAHELRLNHNEILNMTPSLQHPLWNIPATIPGVQAHAQWLTASIGAAADDRRKEDQNTTGELCNKGPETREHLLLRCDSTKEIREALMNSLAMIGPEMTREFEETASTQKLAWLLAGGCCLGRKTTSPSQNRINPLEPVFKKGRSVSAVQDKSDEFECLAAYQQFQCIKAEAKDRLHIYTDGSALKGYAGCGVALYDPNLVLTKSEALGKTTSNVAELEAINIALREIANQNMAKPGEQIHLFTDSLFAQKTLLSTKVAKQHFFLVESIRALGWKLKNESKADVWLHWVPSHIDRTLERNRKNLSIKGNKQADQLAETARNNSNDGHTWKQTNEKRKKLLTAVGNALLKINTMLKSEKKNQAENGPSDDDFNHEAFQDHPNESCDNSVSLEKSENMLARSPM